MMQKPVNTRGNDEADVRGDGYSTLVRNYIIGQLQRPPKPGNRMQGRPQSEDGDRDETQG